MLFSAQAKVLLKNMENIVSDVASVLLISVISFSIMIINLETWKWISSDHSLLYFTFITHLMNIVRKIALFPLTIYLGSINNTRNVRFMKLRLLLNDMVTKSA